MRDQIRATEVIEYLAETVDRYSQVSFADLYVIGIQPESTQTSVGVDDPRRI